MAVEERRHSALQQHTTSAELSHSLMSSNSSLCDVTDGADTPRLQGLRHTPHPLAKCFFPSTETLLWCLCFQSRTWALQQNISFGFSKKLLLSLSTEGLICCSLEIRRAFFFLLGKATHFTKSIGPCSCFCLHRLTFQFPESNQAE